MSRLFLIVLFAIVACVTAQSQNELNFIFNGMIPAQPAPSSHAAPGNCEADDSESQIAELIVEWVAFVDSVASLTDDDAVSALSSELGNYLTADVVLTVSGVDLSGTYNGFSGILQYFEEIANTRNSSLTILSDFQYTWNNDKSVIVTTPYTGYETVWPSGESDSFYGTRVFTAVASGNGWLLSNVVRNRLAGVELDDANDDISQLVASWVAITDAVASFTSVSEVDSTYGSVVGNFFTEDAAITIQGVNGLSDSYTGPAGALTELEDLSNTRNLTTTTLGDLQITWNDDGSASVSAPYTGYETVWPSGESDIFFGIRSFTVVRSNQAWLFSALSRTRVSSVPSVDVEDVLSQLIASWVAISDAVASLTSVSAVDSAYSSVVGDYFTEDATITLQGVTGVATYYSGLSGVLSYLENLSNTRNASNTVLSDIVFALNDDGSYTATVTYVGFETVWPGENSDIFFGVRVFNAVDQDGTWLFSSFSRTRTATIPVSVSSKK